MKENKIFFYIIATYTMNEKYFSFFHLVHLEKNTNTLASQILPPRIEVLDCYQTTPPASSVPALKFIRFVCAATPPAYCRTVEFQYSRYQKLQRFWQQWCQFVDDKFEIKLEAKAKHFSQLDIIMRGFYYNMFALFLQMNNIFSQFRKLVKNM